ncbi:MAG TPA: hypothetical protein VF543_22510 [Pyrinomonadaceae bacterium]
MPNTCRNPKCREVISIFEGRLLCPACSLMARWAFGAGAFVVGVAYGLWRIIKFFM